jgi:hypothetical protein
MFMCRFGDGAALAGSPIPDATGIRPAAASNPAAINDRLFPIIVAALLGGEGAGAWPDERIECAGSGGRV